MFQTAGRQLGGTILFLGLVSSCDGVSSCSAQILAVIFNDAIMNTATTQRVVRVISLQTWESVQFESLMQDPTFFRWYTSKVMTKEVATMNVAVPQYLQRSLNSFITPLNTFILVVETSPLSSPQSAIGSVLRNGAAHNCCYSDTICISFSSHRHYLHIILKSQILSRYVAEQG